MCYCPTVPPLNFVIVSNIGLAINNDEYVPVIKPTISTVENTFNDMPANKKMEHTTIPVDIDV